MIKNENLDAILLTSFDNLRYVADCRIYFTTITLQNSYVALVLPGKPPVIQGPAIEAKHSDSIAAVAGWTGYPLVPTNAMSSRWSSMVATLLNDNGVRSGRVGIDEMSFMSFLELRRILPHIEFAPIYNRMLEVRAVKSQDEIHLIRKAARVVDAGARAGLEHSKPGVREREIVAEMVYEMSRKGSEAEPWAASLTSGKRTLESIFATDKTVEEGDLVVFDLGAISEGYLLQKTSYNRSVISCYPDSNVPRRAFPIPVTVPKKVHEHLVRLATTAIVAMCSRLCIMEEGEGDRGREPTKNN